MSTPAARSGVLWCRAQLVADPADEVAVWLSGMGAREVWINGVLADVQGRPGRLAPATSGKVLRIPSDALRDGRLDLAVRVSVETLFTWRWGPTLDAAVGHPDALEVARHASIESDLPRLLPPALPAIAAVWIGLFLLAFHLRRPEIRGNLALGVGTGALGLSELLYLTSSVGVFPVLPGLRTAIIGLVTLAYPLMMLALAQLVSASTRWVAVFTVAFAARNAMMLWSDTTPQAIALHTALLLGPAAVLMLWMVRRGLVARIPGARTIAVAYAISLLKPAGFVVRSVFSGAELHMATMWVESVAVLLCLGGLAWALSVERLVQKSDALVATNRAATRFVPEDFLRRLGRDSVLEARLGDAARLPLTVMFLDIRGFTTLAEANTPEVVFGLVNELLDRFEPIVRRNTGFITQYTGDGFAALFESADGAVAAARQIQAALAERRAAGAPFPVHAGIGLQSGSVLLGTVGGGEFLAVGMVADSVNLAARVESLTKVYGAPVLITSDTRALLGPGAGGLIELDRVVVKGRSEPIGLFEVLSDALDTAVVCAYRDAWTAYAGGQFAQARIGFTAIGGAVGAARLLADRCGEFEVDSPRDWDGTLRLDHK